MRSNPLYIDIIFEDHVYTATVFETTQLRKFCSDCVRKGKTFRFGKIHQYGDISIARLSQVINQIREFATYDRWLAARTEYSENE